MSPLVAVEGASVPLSLDDFVPAALAGFRATAPKLATTAAWCGAALILLGGLCKASWKLVMAVSGRDVPHLDNFLFVLLATGFMLLARRRRDGLAAALSGTQLAMAYALVPLAGTGSRSPSSGGSSC